MQKYNLAIGVSGSGTTFEAIVKAVKAGKIKMEISFLFADRECGAIDKAKKLGIRVIRRKKSEGISVFHSRIVRELAARKCDFVALAGYLRLLPIANEDPFLVLNSHPAAIPYFGGKGMWGHFVHEAVVSWAKKTRFKHPYTFSTIHIASAEYDRGPVIGIKSCRISKEETPETLAKKLLPIEHQNYIEVLSKLSNDLVEYSNYPKEFITLFK